MVVPSTRPEDIGDQVGYGSPETVKARTPVRLRALGRWEMSAQTILRAMVPGRS
jgi:hypothetical protein